VKNKKVENKRRLMKAKIKVTVLTLVILIGIEVLPFLKTERVEESSLWIEGFEKYEGNPILFPQGTGFEAKATFNPAVILVDGIFYMFYRAEDWTGKGKWNGQSTIGLAWSEDGMSFWRKSEPIIIPEYAYELPGGCEDPRVVKIERTYYLTYTGYDGKTARLCLATSRDLIKWKKQGPIFPDCGWSKSGAIIPEKINGKYWMYFGDSNIWVATSKDLIHWNVIEEPVMKPREDYWDEALVEPGPPPIITEDGIVLIYNGNIPEKRARELGKKESREMVRQYAAGWALFSKDDPTKLIARCDEPFLKPTERFEKIGQVDDVVFSEGLVKRNGRWYLYYGCADTYIGVAISDETILGEDLSKISKPILTPIGSGFEAERVYNPTTITDSGEIYLIYRAEGTDTGTGSFGLAKSWDGINFFRSEVNPIIIPSIPYDEGGCEDPRVVKFGENYWLTYGGNDGGKTPGNICLATSKDLVQWKKHGEIIQPKYEWEYSQIKAGAIVPQKINGKYWMYYQGEAKPWHTKMGIAYSEDLIHWEQALDMPVMEPRLGYFDSQGTEPGCAVAIPQGILVIYNGWNETTVNKAGWALFSKEDPTKLIARCDYPIVSLPNRHVFATALLKLQAQWYLYWGADDRWIDGAIIDMDQFLMEFEEEGIENGLKQRVCTPLAFA
jgi:predicted GH43/DUF377 family glycosyl hydrolase